jgi:ABC-2 type transport system ATP-binding protein
LVGIQAKTAGTVSFHHKDYSIGYLTQEPTLPGHANCEEYLGHVAWLQGVETKKRPEAVAQALAAVGLADRARARIRSLSGGMKQRLAFAGAIVNSPSLLLLDEPTVGLDPIQRERMRALVKAAATGRVVLLSTHLLEDVRALGDHLAIMAEGRVTFQGPPETLVTAPGDEAGYAARFDAAVARHMAGQEGTP